MIATGTRNVVVIDDGKGRFRAQEVRIGEEAGGKNLNIRLSGTLHKSDYEAFVPEIERLIRQHGKLRQDGNLAAPGCTDCCDR